MWYNTYQQLYTQHATVFLEFWLCGRVTPYSRSFPYFLLVVSSTQRLHGARMVRRLCRSAEKRHLGVNPCGCDIPAPPRLVCFWTEYIGVQRLRGGWENSPHLLVLGSTDNKTPRHKYCRMRSSTSRFAGKRE